MARVSDHSVLDALRTIGDPSLEKRNADWDEKVWAPAYLKYVKAHGFTLSDPEVRATSPVLDDGERELLARIAGEIDGALRQDLFLPAEDDLDGEALERKLTEAANAHREQGAERAGDLADARTALETGLRLRSQLTLAQDLFAEYGNEIAAALLLAALPQSYAAAWGARVLTSSGGLTDDLQRRVRQTAQFLALIMTRQVRLDIGKSWAPRGLAWHATVELRLLHGALREHLRSLAADDPALGDQLGERNYPAAVPPDGEPQNVPLNQEDLLGMLLTFSISVFEVLERFGITWTETEQQAYFTMWDHVGLHLGIGDEGVVSELRLRRDVELTLGLPPDATSLRPTSIEEARAVLNDLRDRQWGLEPPDTPLTGQWESLRAGRRLVEALLDELEAGMPRSRKSWPLAVMRQLAPAQVRDRLALGAGGLLEGALERLPPRRLRVGRFTALEVGARAGSAVLRMMANDVARHSIIRFLDPADQPDLPAFVIPGLEDWTDGLVINR